MVEIVALLVKRFRWTREYIGTLDRGWIFQVALHPEDEHGNLDITRPIDVDEQARGCSGYDFYRFRGWASWAADLRMKGAV